ncbi:MAG: hypothetical protein WCA59_22370 [Candidatus Binataceae bacterium]
MKSTVRWKLIVPATVLGASMVVSAFGQSSPSTCSSMSAARNPIKQAGSYAPDATKRAHVGPATVLLDTKVTAEAKTALPEESATEHSDIHVHTTAGVFGMPLEVFDNE